MRRYIYYLKLVWEARTRGVRVKQQQGKINSFRWENRSSTIASTVSINIMSCRARRNQDGW